MPNPYENPIDQLIGGIIQGHALGQQIHRQKMADEAFARQKAKDDQESSIKDIMTRMSLDQNARPVDSGMVQDMMPGMLGVQGGGAYVRPNDPKRTVTYKDSQGNTRDYELYTPVEQQQRATERARAGKVRVNVGGQTAWAAPGEAAKILDTMHGLDTFATPQVGVEMGLPERTPFKNAPQIMTAIGQAANRKAQDQRAAQDRTSREQIATDNRNAANTRSDNSNTTRIKAAGITANTAAANQTAISDRAANQQAEIDKRQELNQIAREKEPTLHQDRLTIGRMLETGLDADNNTLSKGKRAVLEASYKAKTAEVQGLQIRKAKLYGFQAPPQPVLDKIPEGKTATSPDGHIWKRQDGIVYLVQ